MGRSVRIACPFCGWRVWTQLDSFGRAIGGKCPRCGRVVHGPGSPAVYLKPFTRKDEQR